MLNRLISAASRGALLLVIGCLLVSGTASRSSQGAETALSVQAGVPGREVQLPELSPALVEATSLIRASQARSTFSVNGAGLSAAVLDTGARLTHVDFRDRVVASRNFTSTDGGDPGNVTDRDGHGTNAVGIVAANGPHTGVAPGAGLAVLKVLNDQGVGNSTDFGEGLQWVIDNYAALHISVVNMSVADLHNYPSTEAFGQDSGGLRAKIQTLRSLRIPVVVSAGNSFAAAGSQQGMAWPAIFPETVSVGAVFDANVGANQLGTARANTTARDRITPFSQRLHESLNPTARTDLFAPGALLTSSGKAGDSAESTYEGTSEAAPVVAGVILLVQQYYQRQRGSLPTVDQLETWLRAGAVPIKDGDDEDDNVQNTGLTFLRVDALGALQAAARSIGGITISNCQVTPRAFPGFGGTVSISADATAAAGIASVVPVITPDGLAPMVSSSFPVPGMSGLFHTGGTNSYSRVYLVLPSTTPELRTHTVSIRVTDKGGNVATADCGTFTVGGNAVAVTRRLLNRHQQTDRRMVNLGFRRMSALLRAHQLLERRLLRADPADGPPVTRRNLSRHQSDERRTLNLAFRRVSALLRAHQLLERRLLRAW